MRRVGRTVFRAIVTYLTRGRLEAKSCIDYYQDDLFNENFKLLNENVRKESDPSEDHSAIPKRLDAVAGFLKYNYRNHMRHNDADGFQDIPHALQKEKVPCRSPLMQKTSNHRLSCACHVL